MLSLLLWPWLWGMTCVQLSSTTLKNELQMPS